MAQQRPVWIPPQVNLRHITEVSAAPPDGTLFYVEYLGGENPDYGGQDVGTKSFIFKGYVIDTRYRNLPSMEWFSVLVNVVLVSGTPDIPGPLPRDIVIYPQRDKISLYPFKHYQNMQKFRRAARGVGRAAPILRAAQQRAAERVYAPGGVGFLAAQEDFEERQFSIAPTVGEGTLARLRRRADARRRPVWIPAHVNLRHITEVSAPPHGGTLFYVEYLGGENPDFVEQDVGTKSFIFKGYVIDTRYYNLPSMEWFSALTNVELVSGTPDIPGPLPRDITIYPQRDRISLYPFKHHPIAPTVGGGAPARAVLGGIGGGTKRRKRRKRRTKKRRTKKRKRKTKRYRK